MPAMNISKGDQHSASAMKNYTSKMMDCVKDVAASAQGTGGGWDITSGGQPKVSETSAETGPQIKEKPRVEEEGEDWELDDDDEFEKMHAQRLAAMKAKHKLIQEQKAKGHGEYHEIIQDQFLKEVTGSKHVVCHFYHKDFESCKVVDDRMRVICKKFIGTKFIYMDAEKAPFFVGKLMVRVLPAILCFTDGVCTGRMDGLGELGRADFSAAMLGMRLAEKGAIEFSGDADEF